MVGRKFKITHIFKKVENVLLVRVEYLSTSF